MMDRGIGPITRVPPLPPFVTAEELLRDSLPLLDPPSRITVTGASERYLRVPAQGNWVPFDRTVAPYTVEPQDMTQSRRFKAVCFVGPSQSGKSQMLLATALHSVICAPGPVQIIHMTKTDGDAWVEEKLDPAIAQSPAWHERLGQAREDSTFQRKRFKGMRLAIGYPVANQLSSRTQRLVMLTDYDHMPQRLGPKESPEGTPFGMAQLRIRQYMSRGCVLVESTPAFPVNAESEWVPSPAHPHMMPPATAGIVNIYNEGTRGRWYWACPDCGGLFEPTFARLRYDPALEPGEAGAMAEMECPHCQALLPHRRKAERNRAALAGEGGWLHESRSLDAAGRCILVGIHDERIRNTPIASYALNGAAAAFAPWYELVQRYETERRRFERDHDDTDFAKVFYTDIGISYRRPDGEDASGLTIDALQEAAPILEPLTCPGWTRFVIVSVDAQGSWFAISATAFGIDGRRMLIDRFNLRDAPEHARRARDSEGRPRALDPGRYGEDAEVLIPLLERNYRVEGQGWALRPCAMVIDFNGPAGWSDNAEKFWRARRREGLGDRVFLSVGRGGFRVQDRVWLATPERGSKGKRARSIRLLNMAVDRLKDSVLAALGLAADGPGAMLAARHIDRDALAELLAERREEDGYVKRPGVVRNETLDLSVQALALAEFRGLNRINPEAPPDWALGGPGNPHAVLLEPAAPEARQDPKHHPRPAGAPRAPTGIRFLRRP